MSRFRREIEVVEREQLTSSPSWMSAIATTSIPFPSFARPAPPWGKTTTAFGQHEWLKRATVGEMATPIVVRVGEDRVKVLVVNCQRKKARVHLGTRGEERGDRSKGLTAAQRSSTSPTPENPKEHMSAGGISSGASGEEEEDGRGKRGGKQCPR